MSDDESSAWFVRATVANLNAWAADKEMAVRQTQQHLSSLGYVVVDVVAEETV